MSDTGQMTPLPPSPELRGAAAAAAAPLELFSLNDDSSETSVGAARPVSRLRSIAKYESFQPQALACSPPVPLTYGSFESSRPVGSSGGRGNQRTTPARTSLGAVAGSHGVALFRWSKPHVPVMILSHASNATTKTGGISSLSFQPDAFQTLYLAAARGPGVLVWDCSGNSLSPLCGRLGVDNGFVSSESDARITSLAWKPCATTKETTTLAATTASSACLWDLREPSGSTLFKPSLRFGIARRANASSGSVVAAPYVQVACSQSDECAILDASGTIRVFDIRMTDRTRMSTGALTSFSSFRHAGVGLSHMRVAGDGTSWVAWGLDSAGADAVVKVWMSSSDDDTAEPEVAPEDYWFMDGSIDRMSYSSRPQGYRLAGQCTSSNLACARVCPSPIESSIVTVGLNVDDANGPGQWRADLWKLSEATSQDESKLERVVSFRGGVSADKNLTSTLGKDVRLGMLRASELALSTYPVVAEDNEKQKNGEGDTEFGLILCGLTENGYVTSHIIPEALPQDAIEKDASLVTPTGEGIRTSVGSQARVFPNERETAVKDAARMWNVQGDPSIGLVDRNAPEFASSQVPPDGGMPFELDVPVAYAMAAGNIAGVQLGGMTDLTPSNAVPVGCHTPQEEDLNVADARKAAALMEKIEADRIPCPRLCGATFGPGIGGLVTFLNGDVGKMWQWFQRTDSTRMPVAAALTGGSSGANVSKNVVGLGAPGVLGDTDSAKCPRTLQDLIDMTSAAKEAQWGDQDESDGELSPGFRALGDNFFEDDSGSSSDSGEEGPERLVDAASSGKDSKGLYENYFGNYQRPGVASSSDNRMDETDKNEADQKVSAHNVGPSSDMLAPVVRVSREFDQLALNNQSALLAKGWRLGRWDLYVSDDPIIEAEAPLVESSERSIGTIDTPSVDHMGSPLTPSKRGLPRYRFLVPPSQRSPTQTTQIPRVSSSPEIATRMPAYDGLTSIDGDEAGVHGGEYSVRPNMQESMVFLRKLFTHQQQQQEGGQSFPNLLSPPDVPMLPNSLPSSPGRERSSDPSLAANYSKKRLAKSETHEHKQTGVYILRPRGSEPSSKFSEEQELIEIKDVCVHNAEVSRSLGATEKAEVWELLAQTVDGQLSEMGNAFDGWGKSGGEALGSGLVDTLLKYYESLGDVQMLSTMVCVLRGSRRKVLYGDSPHWCILSQGHGEKYDTYIRRYADLLFGWGLLTQRAELRKHLLRVLPQTENDQAVATEGSDERTYGIALVFTCPTCGKEADGNFCRSCQDFAFRCGICENAVRGLFTVCETCGHGGHVEHMKAWFESHSECPSGCGCSCTFVSPVQAPTTEFAGALSIEGTEAMSGSQGIFVTA